MELVSGGRQRATSLPLVLALTSISFFMVALDALVVVTALPDIHRSLGGSIATLEWAVNAYTLTFAAGIITAAAIGDRLGRRRVYVAGLVLFTVASAACALAPNSASLIAARAVQGIGAAAVTPLALTILASTFPPERRGAVVGIFGGIGGLAVAGGPLVGGVVVQGLDWHWIFWINVPIGLAAALGSALFLPSGRGPAGRLDLPAVPLVAGGAAAIAWALVRVGDAGWSDAAALGAFLAGCAARGVRAAGTARAEPMLPLGCSASGRSPRPTSPGSSLGAIFSAAFLIVAVLPVRPRLLAAGDRAAPAAVDGHADGGGAVAGALADRIGARPLIVAGGYAGGRAGLGGAARDTTAGGGYGRFVIPLIIAGVGVSMTLPTVPTAALGAVPPGDVGRASGVKNTLQRFGSAFGIALVSAVFGPTATSGRSRCSPRGYRPAMAVSAAMSLLGAVAATAVGRRRAAAVARPAAPAPAICGCPEPGNRRVIESGHDHDS